MTISKEGSRRKCVDSVNVRNSATGKFGSTGADITSDGRGCPVQKIKVYVVKWNVDWGPSDPVAVALTREKAEELKAAFEKEWLDAFEIVEFEAE